MISTLNSPAKRPVAANVAELVRVRRFSAASEVSRLRLQLDARGRLRWVASALLCLIGCCWTAPAVCAADLESLVAAGKNLFQREWSPASSG